MSKFIEVTFEGKPCYVNVEQVVYFYPLDNGCRVETVIGSIGVDESYEVVKEKATE
jgi:hypothetical protein